jgi:hypothetical protein
MYRSGEWQGKYMEKKQNQDVTTVSPVRVHCGGIAAA